MKKLFLLLLFVGKVFSQTTGANVINVTLVPNTTITTPTLYTLTGFQNIGQTSHTVTIFATCGGCSGVSNNWGLATGGVQGSPDNVNWINIGPGVTGFYVASGIPITLYGFGSYPYLRVVAQPTPLLNTNITFSISYTGTSVPSLALIDTTQNVNKVQTIGQVITGSAGTVINVISGLPNRSIVVYGFSWTVASTLTFLEVGCGNTFFTGGFEFLNLAYTYGTVLSTIYPQSLRPYGACAPNESLSYLFSGTAGSSAFNMTFRYE